MTTPVYGALTTTLREATTKSFTHTYRLPGWVDDKCNEVVVLPVEPLPSADGGQSRYEYFAIRIEASGNVPYGIMGVVAPPFEDEKQFLSIAVSGAGLLSKYRDDAAQDHGIEQVVPFTKAKGVSGVYTVDVKVPTTMRLSVSGHKLYCIVVFSSKCDGNKYAHVDMRIDGSMRTSWTGTELLQRTHAPKVPASRKAKPRSVALLKSASLVKKKKSKKGATKKSKKLKKKRTRTDRQEDAVHTALANARRLLRQRSASATVLPREYDIGHRLNR